MYESFYGFSARPFQLNPDPDFFFASREHRRAMGFVEYGLHQGEGFIVVTGEIGAGKTTVIRNLLAGLDSRRIAAATLVSTQLGADDTLRLVAAAFGVSTRDLPKSDVLLALEARLAAEAARGRRCLLVVDEAQNLAPGAVEELRMLSNFQLGAHALLQTFLVGQPEFRRILQGPGMSQLRQRVIAACHIGPLDAADARGYIEHRLAHVGWKGNPEVTAEACAAVHEASGGIPRRINLICDRVLLSGFLSGTPSFSVGAVREVAVGLEAETLEEPRGDCDAARDGGPGGTQSVVAAGDPREVDEAVVTFRRFLDWIRQGGRDRGDRA
ncbi:MAG: XrtA-associated ATPase [Lysobacter sp.]|nr:XrtA-associated ATPase [Lysobacter sp.]